VNISRHDHGILNSENEADIFALHYIFIPRINQSLKLFQEAWNSHSLSTEQNKSPLQLYHSYSQGSSLFSDEIVDPYFYGCEEVEDEDILMMKWMLLSFLHLNYNLVKIV
jgi:hypothetical protein